MKQHPHYPLSIFFSAEDAGFIAEVPDLPGGSAWGATEADAAREARRAAQEWVSLNQFLTGVLAGEVGA